MKWMIDVYVPLTLPRNRLCNWVILDTQRVDQIRLDISYAYLYFIVRNSRSNCTSIHCTAYCTVQINNLSRNNFPEEEKLANDHRAVTELLQREMLLRFECMIPSYVVIRFHSSGMSVRGIFWKQYSRNLSGQLPTPPHLFSRDLNVMFKKPFRGRI